MLFCNKVNQERPQAGAARVESVFRDEKMLLIFNYIQYIYYILYNTVIVALLQVNMIIHVLFTVQGSDDLRVL